jgi:hypothetical protein
VARLGGHSGSQTDLLTPWHAGRAEIPPFNYIPPLLGGKWISNVGWDAGDLPNLEKYATTLNKHKNPSCRSAVTESWESRNTTEPWPVLGDREAQQNPKRDVPSRSQSVGPEQVRRTLGPVAAFREKKLLFRSICFFVFSGPHKPGAVGAAAAFERFGRILSHRPTDQSKLPSAWHTREKTTGIRGIEPHPAQVAPTCVSAMLCRLGAPWGVSLVWQNMPRILGASV